MEFRIAMAQDTPHVENLWAYCFEPKEDPFFQYYFTNCYEPENTMVGLEQDQLLSTVCVNTILMYVVPYCLRAIW